MNIVTGHGIVSGEWREWERGREGEREGGREGRGDDEIGTCYEEPDCKNYMYIILYAPDNINMANLNMLFVATHTHTHMHTHTHTCTHTHTHTLDSHTPDSHTPGQADTVTTQVNI